MAATRHHANIVQIHEAGVSEGRHFIAMEYLPHTLDEVLKRRGRLRFLDAVNLIANVAGALQAAHKANIIHRDLKPQNILLTDAGVPKVADFGLAKIKDELDFEDSDTEQIVGTPYYMSPEQAVSSKIGVDLRTDIFSLGATLYEALTLQRAFEGDTGPQVLERILMEDPPDPDDVRGALFQSEHFRLLENDSKA